MNKANAKYMYVKSFVEVHPNYPSHVTKIAPKTYFILLSIPSVISSERGKMLKVWRELADPDPWTLPGPY